MKTDKNHHANLNRAFGIADRANGHIAIPYGLKEDVGGDANLVCMATQIAEMSATSDLFVTSTRLSALRNESQRTTDRYLQRLRDAGWLKNYQVKNSSHVLNLISFFVLLPVRDPKVIRKVHVIDKSNLTPEWQAKLEFTLSHVRKIRERREKEGPENQRRPFSECFVEAIACYRDLVGQDKPITHTLVNAMQISYELGGDLVAEAKRLAGKPSVRDQQVISPAMRAEAELEQEQRHQEFDGACIGEALEGTDLKATARGHGSATRVYLTNPEGDTLGFVEGCGTGLFGQDKLEAKDAVTVVLERVALKTRVLPKIFQRAVDKEVKLPYMFNWLCTLHQLFGITSQEAETQLQELYGKDLRRAFEKYPTAPVAENIILHDGIIKSVRVIRTKSGAGSVQDLSTYSTPAERAKAWERLDYANQRHPGSDITWEDLNPQPTRPDSNKFLMKSFLRKDSWRRPRPGCERTGDRYSHGPGAPRRNRHFQISTPK